MNGNEEGKKIVIERMEGVGSERGIEKCVRVLDMENDEVKGGIMGGEGGKMGGLEGGSGVEMVVDDSGEGMVM